MATDINCGLRIADCRLRIADCGLRIAKCGLSRSGGWVALLGIGIACLALCGCVDRGSSGDAKPAEFTGDAAQPPIENPPPVETQVAEQPASDADDSVPMPAKNGGEPRKPAPAAAILDGWTKPAVAIVLSGEQYGYIEPCGCTENQSGGVSRRADLFRQLREKGWSVTGFDLGGLLKHSRRQSQIKFETMLDAMRDMQYQAMALGPQELRLGPEYILSQHKTDADDPDAILTFVAANVTLFDIADIGTPARWKVFDLDGVKIGVTAVIGESYASKALPEGGQSDISVAKPDDALPEILKQLEQQKPDLLVLLSHAGRDESERLAKMFPQFDLLLTAGGPEDGHHEPATVGKTMVVDIGHKGKHAGVVGFYPDAAENRLRFALLDLNKRDFQDTPQMVEHMRQYQNRLKEERIVAVEHLAHPIPHPSGATFVGAEKCGECHTKAYAKWLETPHARAFESLKHAREGDVDYGITRVFDAECLACHVTGWEPQQVLRFESGFVNEEFARDDAEKQMARLLKGQQCESCHGPGSRHIELIDDGKTEESRKHVLVTLEQAKQNVCYSCHDLDNSPKFQFESYWEQVAHPWSD